MSRRNENDAPIETTAPEVSEQQNPHAADHATAHEPGVFDPSDLNPPAPPASRAPAASDAGFGSFG